MPNQKPKSTGIFFNQRTCLPSEQLNFDHKKNLRNSFARF